MRNLLLLLLVIVLLGPLGIDLYLPAIPAIAKGLGSSESLIQSTISLFILVLGAGQLISGHLVDKFGRRPMAMAGMVLYIAGSLTAAFAVTPGMFIASRLIQGAGVCCTSVVAFTCVRDCFNGNEAARAFGFLNGTLNIVPALAPLLGGIMAEYYGWRLPFGFLALYAFILLILTAKYLPETRPEKNSQRKENPLKSLASVLFNQRFLTFSLVNAGTMGMALTYVSLAPVVLMGDAALSPLQFSVVFGANGFWIMAVSMVANRVIRRAGRPVCLVFGGMLMALGCAGLVSGLVLLPGEMQHHWLVYMLPVATACAGLAFIMGPATSYALEPYSDNAGVASALAGFVQMAGGAVFGLLAIASQLPPKAALAVVMLCGALLAWNAYRVSKKEGRIS
ncbi:multidrug effflux MFS transporter [Morganella morganii]|uniref:Bcr/CflA family efflux transporter n=1 Tax=Morganella morganii TaxID=582 RepID=A0AAI9HVY0_MORMO|nr:multidrug effflux MFS transporter [Morganella morganii]EKW8763272.1 multidrug effflux MFS transporter [Morganella morganii]SHN01905.1 MFS transporter, DHA1 family, bicyclomycin/chloramphenicol resistance protein [Morganella morganii]HAS8352397.1 Bcr/CflA family efflux MFS transporter [Vibrio vulnificus]HCE8950164.1 multidrug effflux MFS transporter [Morganella morganii]